MRNLTQEAVDLAKRQAIMFDQHLQDKAYRQRLSEFQKAQLIQQLVFFAQTFELQLIEEIKYGSQ